MTSINTIELLEPNIILLSTEGEIKIDTYNEMVQKRAQLAKQLGYEKGAYTVILDARKSFIRQLDIRSLSAGAAMEPTPECYVLIRSHSNIILNNIAKFAGSFAKQTLLIETTMEGAIKLCHKRLYSLV